MARIKVVGLDSDTSIYDSDERLEYAFVSSPKNGRKQCHEFTDCRDYMHEVIRAYVDKDNKELSPYFYNPADNSPIDTDILRLVLTRPSKINTDMEIWKKKLFSAKAVINIYENMAGWKKSKITTINHTIKEHAWLLTGSKKWMTYPNLLSMLTLILRVGVYYGPFEIKNEKQLAKLWVDLLKKYKNEYDSDLDYIKKCHLFFPILMKRYKDIFIKELKNVYLNEVGHKTMSFHANGGIVSLCTFSSEIEKGELDNRLQKIVKEEGI